MSYERYAPDYRYSSQQQNPLLREAAFIAQQMDSGNADLASQRLRDDLYQLQRSPEQATQLVQLIQQFDRKGSGADFEIRTSRQNGFSVANASIVDYDYFRDGRTGRVQREQYSRDRICTILLPQDGGNRRYSGGYSGQPYYGPNDGQPYYDRSGYDPRFDGQGPFDPSASYGPRFDRGSYYRSQEMANRFNPNDPSNWTPEQAWQATLRFRQMGLDPRQRYADEDFDYSNASSDWQNRQEGYTGYRPDWQSGGNYNPEPSAYLPRNRHNFDFAQQQEEWQQNYQATRNRQRHPSNHRHSHSNGSRQNDSHHSNSGGANINGLDQGTEEALYRAKQMAARDGVNIEVTSGFRSYQDQARLYSQLKGISPVAKPGTSNHESGEAIDVKNYAQAKPYLVAAGFVHGDGKGRIPGDPWHFRYMG